MKERNAAEYQRGYVAGRKRNDKDMDELRKMSLLVENQKQDIYMKALDLALTHCHDWQVEGSPINNAESYCKLARVFAKHSIAEMKYI